MSDRSIALPLLEPTTWQRFWALKQSRRDWNIGSVREIAFAMKILKGQLDL